MTDPEPLAQARDRLEELGVQEPSLTRCLEAAAAVWDGFEGAGRADLFEAWLEELLRRAERPTVKTPAAFVIAALTTNGAGQEVAQRLLEAPDVPPPPRDDWWMQWEYKGVPWNHIRDAVAILSMPEDHEHWHAYASARITARKSVLRKIGMTLEEARELLERRDKERSQARSRKDR